MISLQSRYQLLLYPNFAELGRVLLWLFQGKSKFAFCYHL